MSESKPSLSPEQLYLERLHHNALGLLSRYYPRFLPQEPTEVRFANLGSYIAASYEGRLRGKHYTFLNRKDDSITDEGEVGMLMHELAHQGHAEHVGVEVFQRFDLDELVTDEEFASIPPLKIFRRIDKDFGELIKKVVLSDAIEEGIVLFIHADILTRELESSQALGRKKRTAVLRQALQERRSVLVNLALSRNRRNRYHAQGYAMMMQLFEKLGEDGDALVDFTLSIDLAQTNEIPYGHPDYRAMIANPFLLPHVA